MHRKRVRIDDLVRKGEHVPEDGTGRVHVLAARWSLAAGIG